MSKQTVNVNSVDVKDLEVRALELVDQAAGGDEVILTRDGEPVAKIIPFSAAEPVRRKREFGSAKGMIKMSDDFDEPLEDFRDYM